MNLASLIARDQARAMRAGQLSTGDVLVRWRPKPAGFDPLLESSYAEPEAEQTATLRGFIHFVQPLKSGIRLFAEIQEGDVIVDLPGDATLPQDAAEVSFDIAGARYVQKDVGAALGEYWDTVIGGRRMTRTLLLTRAR